MLVNKMRVLMASHPLKIYLEKKKLTQQEFAKRIGVKQSMISDVINGVTRFSADTALRVTKKTRGALKLEDLIYKWPAGSGR